MCKKVLKFSISDVNIHRGCDPSDIRIVKDDVDNVVHVRKNFEIGT